MLKNCQNYLTIIFPKTKSSITLLSFRTPKNTNKDIIDKYGNEWFIKHIENYNNITNIKTSYNFASLIKTESFSDIDRQNYEKRFNNNFQ